MIAMMRRLLLLVMAACSPSPAKPPSHELVVVATDGGSPVAVVPTPRFTPIWVPSSLGFTDLGDGRRGATINGRRIVLEGTNTRIVDETPIADLGKARKMPDALGGGWIFVGTKALSFAKTFDGPLVPIAKESGAFMNAGFAFDRVLMNGKTYVLSTGKPVAPVVPNAVEMFGLSTGHVVIRTRNNDVWFSPRSDKPFTRVGRSDDVIFYDGAFVLDSSHGGRRLGLDGKVTPLVATGSFTTSDNIIALSGMLDTSTPPSVASVPDRIVAALAVTLGDRSVIRVEAHDLVFFDVTRGAVASTQKDAFAGHESCSPLRGGSPAFVGCIERDGMSLFRIESADQAPVLERVFKDVYSASFGFPPEDAALAVPRRCDGSIARGAFCVRRSDGTWFETIVADPKNLLGTAPITVHTIASRDGTPYMFEWENGSGDLLFADGRAKIVRAIPRGDISARAMSLLGWNAVSVRDGRLVFLLAGTSPGIMTIDPAGKITERPLTGNLAAVGKRGLLVSPDGKITETSDAGTTWHDVDPPPGGAALDWVACNQGGCTVGPWNRLGWGE
jgi:hypothetical protein